MAKDYNQVLLDKGYSQEQIDAMVGAVNSGQNANDVVQNYTPTTPSSSSSSSSSGGNYVYNESTGYYEQQTPSSSSSNSGSYTYNPTSGYYEQQSTPSGRSPQQTTQTQNTQQPKQQTQTAGSTVSDVQQQGVMKPLSQEYYNQTSDNALNTIRNNLNNYRQTNPEYFTDYDTFKRNFSYDSRNDEQKNLLDTWYNGYQSQLQLSSVPTTDLYTQYKDGQLSAADLEGLRVSNPEKYAELQAQINKGNIIAAYDDDKGVDTTGLSLQDMAYNMAMQTFTKFMNGETSSAASNIFREYEDKMESPEMLSLSDKTTEVQEQIENIQSDLDSIKKSVEAEYAGTGASRSKINAIIADRSYDLQLQLRTLNSEYNKYATQYNNRMQQYQNEFQLQLQEYQINQQARQQQMNELGFAIDLMSFETPQQAQERQWEYWVKQQEYTNGNINSKDYQTRYKAALTSVQNLLSQYPGIPMVRSAEQMAQDVLKAIDAGSDLGTELTKINQQIQGKPEYKYMYNQTYRPATSSGSTGFSGKSIKVGDMELFEYNGQWLTAEEIKSIYGSGTGTTKGAAKPYNVVDSSVFSLQATSSRDGNLGGFLRSIGKVGSKGGQCGKFVNDYLQKIGVGRYYDDELSTKLNSVNDYTPQKGLIAVFDYGHKSSDGINHGHVGIVTQVYEDGSFDVLDSNYGSDGKIQKRRVYPEEKSFKGFFNPSKAPLNGTTTTQAQSSDAFTRAGNNIALNLGSVSATNTFNEQLKNYVDNGKYTNAFEYITTQAKQSADSDTRQAINSAESAISALVSIQQGLDAFEAAGGNTGIFAGTTEQVANKIGKTTNPELKKLATQINVAIQKYRQAISGAAFSEQEAAEYAAIFPSTKNDKALNTALIEGTLDTMLQNLNSSYASILGTDTYTSLLQAYQDTTGNIYDYYGGKQSLTKYLKDNGYFVSNGVQTTQKKQTKTQTSTQTTTGTIASYVVTKALNNVIAKYKLK